MRKRQTDFRSRTLSPEELMAEAFGAVSRTSHSAKFIGQGYKLDENVQIKGERQRKPRRVVNPSMNHTTRADLHFSEMMAGEVKALPTKTTHFGSSKQALRWHSLQQLSQMSAAELHALTKTQRNLLKRSRRGATINAISLIPLIQGEIVQSELISEIEAAVFSARQQKASFIRVIMSDNKASQEAMVCRSVVIAWSAGEGIKFVRAWAPEMDLSGVYESMVLEIR